MRHTVIATFVKELVLDAVQQPAPWESLAPHEFEDVCEELSTAVDEQPTRAILGVGQPAREVSREIFAPREGITRGVESHPTDVQAHHRRPLVPRGMVISAPPHSLSTHSVHP